MGERRSTGQLSQKTLGTDREPDRAPPPEVDPQPEASQPPAVPPAVYAPVTSSSVELRERQMRWLKERDRHQVATASTIPAANR
jgi:hypothetical protein